MDITQLTTISTETVHGTTRKFVKFEINGYQDLGYYLDSILRVCSQALETDLHNQIISNIDYYRLLELAQNLIPHPEFEQLDREILNQRKTAKS